MSLNKAMTWWKKLSYNGRKALAKLHCKVNDPYKLSEEDIIYIWQQEH